VAAMKPKVRQDLAVVELDGEAVIYDEAAGSLHHLNPSATIVFRLCDGSATVKELAADIAAAVDIETAEVERQIRSALKQFRDEGLLERPVRLPAMKTPARAG
jgi:PqqD family protein of HPr-rel-A system